MKLNIKCILVAVILGVGQRGASAHELARLSDADACWAIVGEAAGASYEVKLGIAGALRNRAACMKKPLRGVYGFTASHNSSEPAWVLKSAKKAWLESVNFDITRGAVNFGNKSDVEKGTFAGLTLTVVLGHGKNLTYFFKP